MDLSFVGFVYFFVFGYVIDKWVCGSLIPARIS